MTDIARHREFGVALADYYSDKLLNEAYERQMETFFATGLNAPDDPALEPALALYSKAWLAQYGLPYEPSDWTECILTFTEDTQN